MPINEGGKLAIDAVAAGMSTTGVGAIFGALLKGFTSLAEAIENPAPNFVTDAAVHLPMLWLVPDLMKSIVTNPDYYHVPRGLPSRVWPHVPVLPASEQPGLAADFYKLTRIFAGAAPVPAKGAGGNPVDALKVQQGDATAFDLNDAHEVPADPSDPMTSPAFWKPVIALQRGTTPTRVMTAADARAELTALRHLAQVGALGKWVQAHPVDNKFRQVATARIAALRKLAGEPAGPDPALSPVFAPTKDPKLGGVEKSPMNLDAATIAGGFLVFGGLAALAVQHFSQKGKRA